MEFKDTSNGDPATISKEALSQFHEMSYYHGMVGKHSSMMFASRRRFQPSSSNR